MAKMTVDRLVDREARDAPCRTHEIPLGATVAVADLPRVVGVPTAAYAALAGRYGHAAHDVLAVARERPELARAIVSELPDLLAEVVFAARREQARTLGDVLLRRTRLGLLAGRDVAAAGDAARRVADALAAELCWDEAEVAAQLAAWAAEARAEGVVGSA
jgi:glycerol-3-phosphate dehydrogenase